MTDKVPRVIINGDRVLEGLKISNSSAYPKSIDLKSHKLVLGKAGLVLRTTRPTELHGGALTSSSGLLKITSTVDSRHLVEISTAISDNGKQKVGVDLVREDKGAGHRGIWLLGDKSNTFTGSFNIKGAVKLNLSKKGGATAISGDLNITNGGEVRIIGNEQINNKSRVLLRAGESGRSSLNFAGLYQADITESFHQLTVDGRNVLDFGLGDSSGYMHGTRKLILDDLEILNGGHLAIRGWQSQRDFLLVRKDSKLLADALKKLTIDGWGANQVYLKDYDKDYYSIEAAPEPAVYGAVISVLAVGLAARRRKRKRLHVLA